MYFRKVDHGYAIIKDGYVERQVEVYTRTTARDGTYIYVEIGKGRYLKVAYDHSTHNPKVRVLVLDVHFDVTKDDLGRMVVDERPRRRRKRKTLAGKSVGV